MSTTSAWACGTSELTPCTCLRMLSTDRFCESRMREILTSGSTRGEDVVPSHRLLSYSTCPRCTFGQPDLVSELLTRDTSDRCDNSLGTRCVDSQTTNPDLRHR